MQINYPHLASLVFNQPLLATRTAVDAVKSVLVPRIQGINGSSLTVGGLELSVPDSGPQPEKLARGSADECDVPGMYTIANGRVAVIPVHGLLMARRGHITQACTELNSYERIHDRLLRAMNSTVVEEVVLDFNTGGGMAVGCKEMADAIFELRAQKPITAIVNHGAYSAGYFMASACSKVLVSATSGVGSIGVIMEHMEMSKLEETMGLKFTTLYRGDHKNDGSPHEPITEQALAELNSRLDATYKMFVESVAKYRNLDVQAVMDTQARCFGAEEAISLGLADELITPMAAINRIASPYMSSTSQRGIGVRASAMDIQSQL